MKHLVFIFLGLAGCASAPEPTWQPSPTFAERPAINATRTTTLKPRVDAYITFALANRPDLSAAWARLSSSKSSRSVPSRFPEPMLMMSVLAYSDAMDPDLRSLGVEQAIPWPSRLTRGVEAANHRALAEEAMTQAAALDVAQGVSIGFWDLWQTRRLRDLAREHLEVLKSLAEVTRSRVTTGQAALADQLQVDLATSRLEDDIASMDRAESMAEARLRAFLGADGTLDLPTPTDGPTPSVPDIDDATLKSAIAAHPSLRVFEENARASSRMADVESSQGMPNFLVRAEWMKMNNEVMLGAGVSLPLWRSSYDDASDAMRADALAKSYDGLAAADAALAEARSQLAAIQDATRRFSVLNSTLVPQAEEAYQALIGAYAAGGTTIAQILLTQRDILDLRISLVRTRFDFAVAAETLQKWTARPIPTESQP